MGGVNWFLLGVLTGVFITIACAASAFSKSVGQVNDQGEQDDG
tara:strand:+ start:307 stop:435 length:129 start_codon:yes stop_codon:yes gene_type:complete